MFSPEQAWPILFETIRDDLRHAHYPRVTERADLYRKLITGEGIDTLLQRIVSREDDRQFDLRKKLFFPVVNAISHRADVPFSKVHRADGTVATLTYNGPGAERKRQRLDKAMDEFFGSSNLADYMADRFRELNRLDPNAFIINEFKPFDHRKSIARPYPLEITSWQAINYAKELDEPTWMIAMFDQPYKTSANTTIDGHRFVMYFGDVLDLHQVEFNSTATDKIDFGRAGPQTVTIGNRTFTAQLLHPFAQGQKVEFQGVQPGHIKDPATHGETFISYLDYALSRLMSTLKTGSEHSLTMALCAHPEIFTQLPSCEGNIDSGCDNGKRSKDGKPCTVCDGGKNVATTMLRAFIRRLPPNWTKEDLVDLSQLKHYSSPDAAIIEVMDKYLKDQEDQAIRDIFTSIRHKRSVMTATATEINEDVEAMNDALYSYAQRVSAATVKMVYISAKYVDAEQDLVYTHTFPDQFGLESLDMLLDNMTKAKNSGVSPVTTSIIEDRIDAKLLKGKPDELQRLKVIKKFRPLANLPDALIQSSLSAGELGMPQKTLLLYESDIYRELDQVQGFYYLPVKKQKELIDAEVQKIMDLLAEARATALDFQVDAAAGDPAEQDTTDTGSAGTGDAPIDTVQDTALNGAQVSSLVEIITKVALGELTSETAKALIKAAFPAVDDSLVESMLTGVKPIERVKPEPTAAAA